MQIDNEFLTVLEHHIKNFEELPDRVVKEVDNKHLTEISDRLTRCYELQQECYNIMEHLDKKYWVEEE